MGVSVGRIGTRTVSTTTVEVSDAPDLKAAYLGFMIAPRRVDIEFEHTSASNADGWTRDWWIACRVVVHGPKILKPGRNGERRLSATLHEAWWCDHRAEGVQALDLPEWLDEIVSDVRPHGELRVQGGR